MNIINKNSIFDYYRVVHYNAKATKARLFDTHLPSIKQTNENNVPIKHSSIHQSKRNASTVLPAIVRHTSSVSNLNNAAPTTNEVETPSPPTLMAYNTAVHEAAQRFMLRNNMAKFAQDSSSVHVTHTSYPRRSTLYDHIPAKIDTGLARGDSKESPEPETHQLEPGRPVNWSALKNEIEQDIYIRTHTKRIQFNAGTKYATQLTILGNLIRTKIKSHLTSATGSGDERYKIIVHLTIFPATAGGLHVASRCLWNTQTDNSITIKMQGVDCDILVVAFLCYTDIGRI